MADFIDKAQHKAEELAGTAKEKAGEATGDDSLRAEGATDQAKANTHQAADKASDVAENVADSAAGAAKEAKHAASDVADPENFREAVIRLMRGRGLYVEAPIEVDVIEDTLFATHVALPANIVEGDYIARVFLLHGGQVLDLHESIVGVRKVGLERWLYALAYDRPLVYGLLSLVIAIIAGWGASEAFRLLRR